MAADRRLNVLTAVLLALAAGAFSTAVLLHPPTIRGEWLAAFLTLLALAVAGALLALKITEGGSSTSLEFIPQLGAIPLLGPVGAIALTIITQLITEFLVLRKPTHRALFNTGQASTSIAAASFIYVAFRATPSLATLPFAATFPPFLVGVGAFFAINTTSVAYAISVIEGKAFHEIWHNVAGNVIVFDLVMSPVAYLVAVLYVKLGGIALLATIIPIVGLRYSYGIILELQHLNQDLLRVLVKTLEARDRYTSGHSIRVAERAKTIAQALGLSAKDVRLIETGALLHDIGKIDLAYGEILRQAGPLTPEQRELIRAHPDKGVEILSAVRSIDPMILQCVRHHHEWFDGSGYPVGLAGQDIPVGARIIMVSDSIDAMLTDRPYRAALSIEDVSQELIRNSGTQFDPEVVEAVFATRILDEEPLRHPSLQGSQDGGAAAARGRAHPATVQRAEL